MAIAQRGTATTGTHPNGTSVSAAKPTGVKNGDVLIAALVTNNQAATAPSGWVKFEDDTVDTFRSQLYYKVAGGFEPGSYTFTVGSAAPLVLAVSAWSGVDRDTPLGGATQLASAGNASEPVATPDLTNAACTDGITLYVRASRKADSSPGSPLAFTSEKRKVADAGIFSGGSVSYSVGVFADEVEFSEPGTKTGAGVTASGAETHNVVATVILNRGPYQPQTPVLGAGEVIGVEPPTGIFTVNETLTLEDDYLPSPSGSLTNRVYYRLVPLPAGKCVYRMRRQPTPDPDVIPDRIEYPSTVTTVAEALQYDLDNAPIQQFQYDSNGYAVGIYAVQYAYYNQQSEEWVLQEGNPPFSRSYVLTDLPD